MHQTDFFYNARGYDNLLITIVAPLMSHSIFKQISLSMDNCKKPE